MDMNPFFSGFIGQWHMILRCSEDSCYLYSPGCRLFSNFYITFVRIAVVMYLDFVNGNYV